MEPVILIPSNQCGSPHFGDIAILASLDIFLSLMLVRLVNNKIAPPIVYQSHDSLQSGKYKKN